MHSLSVWAVTVRVGSRGRVASHWLDSDGPCPCRLSRHLKVSTWTFVGCPSNCKKTVRTCKSVPRQKRALREAKPSAEATETEDSQSAETQKRRRHMHVRRSAGARSPRGAATVNVRTKRQGVQEAPTQAPAPCMQSSQFSGG